MLCKYRLNKLYSKKHNRRSEKKRILNPIMIEKQRDEIRAQLINCLEKP